MKEHLLTHPVYQVSERLHQHIHLFFFCVCGLSAEIFCKCVSCIYVWQIKNLNAKCLDS